MSDTQFDIRSILFDFLGSQSPSTRQRMAVNSLETILRRAMVEVEVVPPAGIEPAPQSGPNFKSGVSTSSTKGADRYLKFSGRGQFPKVMADVLEEIKLPFGWGIEARDGMVSWRTGAFLGDDEYQVRIICGPTVDNMTGERMEGWNGRWWRLSQNMTPGEIVQTVFKATMTAMEHEAREMFLYKGVTVLDPHYDIDKLAEFRKQAGSIKGRDAA